MTRLLRQFIERLAIFLVKDNAREREKQSSKKHIQGKSACKGNAREPLQHPRRRRPPVRSREGSSLPQNTSIKGAEEFPKSPSAYFTPPSSLCSLLKCTSIEKPKEITRSLSIDSASLRSKYTSARRTPSKKLDGTHQQPFPSFIAPAMSNASLFEEARQIPVSALPDLIRPPSRRILQGGISIRDVKDMPHPPSVYLTPPRCIRSLPNAMSNSRKAEPRRRSFSRSRLPQSKLNLRESGSPVRRTNSFPRRRNELHGSHDCRDCSQNLRVSEVSFHSHELHLKSRCKTNLEERNELEQGVRMKSKLPVAHCGRNVNIIKDSNIPKEVTLQQKFHPKEDCYRNSCPQKYARKMSIQRYFANHKFEQMFKLFSKKRGALIDVRTHIRWLRCSDITFDKNGSFFRHIAGRKVALTLSEYKCLIQEICTTHDLDYFEILEKMANASLLIDDAVQPVRRM